MNDIAQIPINEMTFAIQKKHKPKFEEFCAYYLTDDTLKEGVANLCMMFSSYSIKMRWCAFNSHSLVYRGVNIGYLEIGGKVQVSNCKMNWLRISVGAFADKHEADTFAKTPENERCDGKCGTCGNSVRVALSDTKHKRVCKFNRYHFENPTVEQFQWFEKFIELKRKQVDSSLTKNKVPQNKRAGQEKSINNDGIFIGHLSGEAREFCLRMEKLLDCDDVILRHGKNSTAYFPNTGLKQQPLVLRYMVDNGLSVELKLNFIAYYANIIETMPEHIKAVFREIKHCRYKMCEQGINCGMRRTWTLDGKHYYLCSFKFYFCPNISNPNDAEHYAKIIRAEAIAAIGRKKHITEIYE